MIFTILFLCFVLQNLQHKTCESVAQGKLEEYLSWKQMGYDFYGVKYSRDSDIERKAGPIVFEQEVTDSEKFFIQYNNVPIGLAVTSKRDLLVTVPRRRHGIPSTLNLVSSTHQSHSPLLKPLPWNGRWSDLVSVYRPAVDRCDRLWVVDTGLLEVPDARRQVQPPSIVVYDLNSKDYRKIFKYELKATNLVNNRTSGGLTSITVEVDPKSCDSAYAYINDLATETLVVFSLKHMDSWSFAHPSFRYDEASLNFTVAGHVISWRDGMFSTALSDPDSTGRRKLYYHPLVSTKEFSVYTDALKIKGNTNLPVVLEGDRGPNTQSGSHAYHSGSGTLMFASLAQDAVLCWRVDKPLSAEHVAVVAQDHHKLVYISDLKVVGDEVWILVNQMPRFVFDTLPNNEYNFFVHRGNIYDLIKGTTCEA